MGPSCLMPGANGLTVPPQSGASNARAEPGTEGVAVGPWWCGQFHVCTPLCIKGRRKLRRVQ